MPRSARVRPILRLAIAASVASALSGCVAGLPNTSASDAATTAVPTKAPAACIERARLVSTEQVRTYHERLLASLRTTAEPQFASTFNGRYAIGFESTSFWVEPALDVWLSDGTTIVDVRQTGRLSGRYAIDADGVISTSDVIDERATDLPVDPASGAAATIARQILEHNPIEGAIARCDGEDLVLQLSQPAGGSSTVRLPAG